MVEEFMGLRLRRIFPAEEEEESTPLWASAFVTTGNIDHGSNAAIDNFCANAFTWEMWVKLDLTATSALMSKGPGTSISFYYSLAGEVRGLIFCAGTNAYSRIGSAVHGLTTGWHHIAFYYNNAGDRKVYAAFDGTWASAYVGQTAGDGNVVSDAAQTFLVADGAKKMTGSVGWYRLSNNDRYSHTTNFTPPAQASPPATDGNTILLVHMDEGAGVTVDNETGAAALDGTILNGTWQAQ